LIEPIVVDFETDEIIGNPIVNPPEPVGCAVWVPGTEPFYMAWGHPTENNIDYDHAHRYLSELRDCDYPLLFHSQGFDIPVWNKYFCNAVLPLHGDCWKRYHDTLYLVFLADPYAPTFSLKPSADRWLDMPPVEQDELRAWILSNIPGAMEKDWGRYIRLAPGGLVGRYAVGDVVRTGRLFSVLHKKIVEEGMEQAYDRERRLFPTLMFATRRGIPIDRDTLEHHTSVYATCLELAQSALGNRLGISDLSLCSDDNLADALDKADAIECWTLTKTGKRSMAKDNLRIKDPWIKMHMDYISRLKTCLQTFMRPWLELSYDDGRLHPNWNQVRQSRSSGNGAKGTRTGRLSSDSPNFQNVPTEFEDNRGQALPVPEGLHPLPMLRRYCLPEPGHVWLKRDYSSQEIRILAHFEDGSLCEAYRANPSLDPHQMARELIEAMVGIIYARKDVKITAFSIIYGSGATGLSIQLGRGYDEAWRIKEAYLDALPGVRALMQDVTLRGKNNLSIKTLGGRVYYKEPSKEVDGRFREYSYKLLNYLIQGSAADQTKESICDWRDQASWDVEFLATVHDEINISAPADDWQRHMLCLKTCMNREGRIDLPVLSDGYYGMNWQDIIPEDNFPDKKEEVIRIVGPRRSDTTVGGQTGHLPKG
jgi:DNA polymerase I-like protein with 3'-5' exonuclease and polymerase domains